MTLNKTLVEITDHMYAAGIVDYRRAVRIFKKHFLHSAIAAHQGNAGAAALKLNIHRNTMSRDRRTLGLRAK